MQIVQGGVRMTLPPLPRRGGLKRLKQEMTGRLVRSDQVRWPEFKKERPPFTSSDLVLLELTFKVQSGNTKEGAPYNLGNCGCAGR